MPAVKRIIHIMEANQQQPDGYSMESYNTQYQLFSKAYAKAKDFVKFLSTLERQFKQLRGDMSVIEETLPSLLTGLKLIWTISRLINQKEQEMEDILDAISHEICDKVKSQIDITKIFKKKPEEAIMLIRKGKDVLKKWKSEFDLTRRNIESELTVRRWDFQSTKDIFSTPIYMVRVLEDLESACIIIQEFNAILGSDLKAVTGIPDAIDLEAEKVKD